MKRWGLIIPQFFFLIILILGLVLGLVQSLGYIPGLSLTDWTIDYYITILSSKEVWKSISFSLWISSVSATISLFIALFICYQKFPKYTEYLNYLPIMTPYAIAGLLALQWLGTTGILSRLLVTIFGINITQNLPSLFFKRHGLGVILTYIWKQVPFIIFYCYTMFRQIDSHLGEAAKTLGASPLQVYLKITIPICMPTIMGAYLMVLSYALGAYELPKLLGPTLPKALAVRAYIDYTHPDLMNKPLAMAQNGILFLISFIILLLYWILSFKYSNRKVREEY